MNLILFLLRESWLLVVLDILAGAVSSSANIFLIALINHAISQAPVLGNGVLLSFVGWWR